MPVKKEYIIDRQGKSFVLYEGLLDQAHQEGLKRVSTHLVQVPAEQNGNVAIVTAEVETAKGIFSGIGDASPQNVNRNIAPHLVRMAETRAKARAFRDAVNVGVAAIEELGADIDDEDRAEAPAGAVAEPRQYDGPKASPHKPASANQLATITKLSRLVNEPEGPMDGLSALDASERITELSRLYEARKRTPNPIPAPPAPTSSADGGAGWTSAPLSASSPETGPSASAGDTMNTNVGAANGQPGTATPSPAGEKMATAQQLGTIQKLMKLLGEPGAPDEYLSFADAGKLVVELQNRYTARKKAGTTA